MKTTLYAAITAFLVLAGSAVAAPPPQQQTGEQKPIKIALIHGLTGIMEAYAKQGSTGFRMGLEYATGGTMTVLGRKIEVIEKDDQLKPEIGKTLLAEAFGDQGADLAVGPTSSGVALAMLPVAKEYKKLLIVEPAVADAITGDKWNRYIFRTGRSSTQDAIASAAALGDKQVKIATIAQDYAFGRDGVASFKEALRGTKSEIVYEEYVPQTATDFTAAIQRVFDRLKDQKGEKLISVLWAGTNNPITKIKERQPERYGIKIGGPGNIHALMTAYKGLDGMEGVTYYYYELPKNPVNDWLVKEHTKRYGTPPDYFTAGGMAAAIAAVEGLKKAGSTDTEKLISAMEGMEFQTPKGKMIFRKDDHQALQSMYHFRIKTDPKVPWGVPTLVRELKIEDIQFPVRNKRDALGAR
jgi:branched-chain amino acid transport system substrate-binding protein